MEENVSFLARWPIWLWFLWGGWVVGLLVMIFVTVRVAGPTKPEVEEQTLTEIPQSPSEVVESLGFSLRREKDGEAVGVKAPARFSGEAVAQTAIIATATDRVELQYIQLFSGAYWTSCDATQLTYENGVIAGFSTLSQPEYLQLARQSGQIAFVGLASSAASCASINNSNLAIERARTLGEKFVRQANIDPQTKQLWGVSLGEAQDTTEPNSIAERRQRAAIIVGITGNTVGLNIAELIGSTLPFIEMPNVSLDRYERSSNPSVENLSNRLERPRGENAD